MYYSLFEIFSIGVGPSSSHTVGPMRAAKRYLDNIRSAGKFEAVSRIDVTLYGSLALTGVGHGTVKAVVYGLMGLEAEAIDPEKPLSATKFCIWGRSGPYRSIWMPMSFSKKILFCRNIPTE